MVTLKLEKLRDELRDNFLKILEKLRDWWTLNDYFYPLYLELSVIRITILDFDPDWSSNIFAFATISCTRGLQDGRVRSCTNVPNVSTIDQNPTASAQAKQLTDSSLTEQEFKWTRSWFNKVAQIQDRFWTLVMTHDQECQNLNFPPIITTQNCEYSRSCKVALRNENYHDSNHALAASWKEKWNSD